MVEQMRNSKFVGINLQIGEVFIRLTEQHMPGILLVECGIDIEIFQYTCGVLYIKLQGNMCK